MCGPPAPRLPGCILRLGRCPFQPLCAKTATHCGLQRLACPIYCNVCAPSTASLEAQKVLTWMKFHFFFFCCLCFGDHI